MRYIFTVAVLTMMGLVGWRAGQVMTPESIAFVLSLLVMAIIVLTGTVSIVTGSQSHTHYHLHEADRRPTIVVHSLGVPTGIDERLRPTGDRTEDGYTLYRGSANYPPSQIVKDHTGYSVYRTGSLIAMKEIES